MKNRTIIRARAKSAASQTRADSYFQPDNCDVEVRRNDDRPNLLDWIATTSDGFCYEFDTENDACAFQRDYRKELGLDPMTGERNS